MFSTVVGASKLFMRSLVPASPAPTITPAMAPSSYVQSADGRAQGAAVDTGSRRWVILAAVSASQLAGSLAYDLPVACPCSHVVGDLVAGKSYRVDAYDGPGGSVVETVNASTAARALSGRHRPSRRRLDEPEPGLTRTSRAVRRPRRIVQRRKPSRPRR